MLANIRWRIDGVHLGGNLPSDITPGTKRDDNNFLVHILTIMVGPQYNGTEIVCVAEFDNSNHNEMTPPAIL